MTDAISGIPINPAFENAAPKPSIGLFLPKNTLDAITDKASAAAAARNDNSSPAALSREYSILYEFTMAQGRITYISSFPISFAPSSAIMRFL